MRALVVYESMYGNTRTIAEAVADGLRAAADVEVVNVHDADAALARGAGLLVVGGPTHAGGMTRPTTRQAALDAANQLDSDLTLDPDADGPGVREWLDSLDHLGIPAAAFDIRVDLPSALTGRAAKGIARKLRDHGCPLVGGPESFLVTGDNTLLHDEEEHARRWGECLARHLVPATRLGP